MKYTLQYSPVSYLLRQSTAILTQQYQYVNPNKASYM